MKKLAGTWLVADKDGKPTDQVASVIKVTAGGSAVHETLFPGQPHEMVSVYTVDGPDLIMTHYCVLGNQPRMKADPKSPANQIVFHFAGGANLDPKKDKHMHEATLTIVDDDRHRGERHRLGKRCAREGNVLRPEARSQEVAESPPPWSSERRGLFPPGRLSPGGDKPRRSLHDRGMLVRRRADGHRATEDAGRGTVRPARPGTRPGQGPGQGLVPGLECDP